MTADGWIRTSPSRPKTLSVNKIATTPKADTMQSAAQLSSSTSATVIRGLLEWETVADNWVGTFFSSGPTIDAGDYQAMLFDGRTTQLVVSCAGTNVPVEGDGPLPPSMAGNLVSRGL